MTESAGREKLQNEIVRGRLMWGTQHPVAHNDHNLVRLGSSGKHLRYLCLAFWGLARVPGVTMASSHLTSPSNSDPRTCLRNQGARPAVQSQTS